MGYSLRSAFGGGVRSKTTAAGGRTSERCSINANDARCNSLAPLGRRLPLNSTPRRRTQLSSALSITAAKSYALSCATSGKAEQLNSRISPPSGLFDERSPHHPDRLWCCESIGALWSSPHHECKSSACRGFPAAYYTDNYCCLLH